MSNVTKLVKLLRSCEEVLGTDHRDLVWYDTERPQRLTRKAFFETYAWAMLVWNRKRTAAEGFIRKRKFWEIFTLSETASTSAKVLVKRVGVDSANRFGRRLLEIAVLGRQLGGMTLQEFRDHYFLGARRGHQLGRKHANHLLDLGIYGVGPANAAFIIRNLGGELIKCDRWILALMAELGVDLADLAGAASQLGWGLGRVDAVLWSYCEQEVGAVAGLGPHLRNLGY